MWVVISVTGNVTAARKIRELLKEEGLLTELRPVAKKGKTGIIEIRVLESEAMEAREILTEHGML